MQAQKRDVPCAKCDTFGQEIVKSLKLWLISDKQPCMARIAAIPEPPLLRMCSMTI